jgi:hypothetical protein
MNKIPGFTAEASMSDWWGGYRVQTASNPSGANVAPQLRAEWGCDCFPCGDGGTCCVCCDGCGPKP